MPIGSIDYVSTLPWNDPVNPFPQYAQVTVNLTILANEDGYPAGPTQQTLTLISFNPEGLLQYANAADIPVEDKVILEYEFGNAYVGDDAWRFVTGDDVWPLAVYRNEQVSVPRAIPAGYVQGNAAWVSDGDVLVDATTISIVPVTTYLTPWEYRRRRTLEMI